MTDPACLFCRIVAGDVEAERVHEDEHVIAIRDIHAVAPVHLLLISRRHLGSAAELTDDEGPMLGRLFAAAAQLAAASDIGASGYRLVTNVGADGGQSVAHLHVHLLGGRRLAWPPG
jgi:histidine triad (HIT) family protein